MKEQTSDGECNNQIRPSAPKPCYHAGGDHHSEIADCVVAREQPDGPHAGIPIPVRQETDDGDQIYQQSDESEKAQEVYSWLHQWRIDDGSYWTGYQFMEDVLWPDEKPTWTAGAILLAADALTEYTPAAKIFTEVCLIEAEATNEKQCRLKKV